MADEEKKSEPRIKRAWGTTAAWIAGITTVVGFAGTLSGAFTSMSGLFHRHKDSDAQIAVAQTQIKEGEYQQAFDTYSAVLKADPGYKQAVTGQLAVAEMWAENYEVDSLEDKSAIATAKAQLDGLASEFEGALGSAKGTEKADIEAHLGWVHWLQHHLLGQDTSATAKKDYLLALAIDPNNAYANAMLGNYLTQTYGSLSEAVHDFDVALSTGKAHEVVRRLQLAGLIRMEVPGARAALIRVLNSMRKSGEPLDADTRLNARGFCCTPEETEHDQLVESLSAVPPDEAFQTYIWLHETDTDLPPFVLKLHQLFVKALLTEISGDNASALKQLRELNKKIDGFNTSLDQCVPEEIKRLTSVSR